MQKIDAEIVEKVAKTIYDERYRKTMLLGEEAYTNHLLFQCMKEAQAVLEVMEKDNGQQSSVKVDDGVAQRVVNAACQYVNADTYKHPTKTRTEATTEAIKELHEAVSRYHGAQPAVSALRSSEMPNGEGEV